VYGTSTSNRKRELGDGAPSAALFPKCVDPSGARWGGSEHGRTALAGHLAGNVDACATRRLRSPNGVRLRQRGIRLYGVSFDLGRRAAAGFMSPDLPGRLGLQPEDFLTKVVDLFNVV